MHLFGLTGGIASGKSTVSARLRARGVPVVDADGLAREVVAPGSEGLAEIAKVFGEAVILPDGTLDRKAVAAVVFADEEKRRALNAITHPRIGMLGMQRASELAAAGHPLACYEAPLLVENGLADAFRPLVVVAASESVQVARAMSRDGATEEEARARVRAQRPLAEKVAVADYVVENEGSMADLARKADELLEALCARFGVDIARYPAPGDPR